MAIRLITGVPRAGKTYFVVNHIVENYCIEFGDTYVLKDDVLLISNIDGLMLDYVDFEDMISENKKDDNEQKQKKCPKCGSRMIVKAGRYGNFYSCSGFPSCKQTFKIDGDQSGVSVVGLHKVFSDGAMKRLRDENPYKRIVIVVDECQRWFHRKFYDREVFYSFEYHGHYGIDIYLVAHHSYKVSSEIVNLIEFEFRAVPRSLSVGGFHYLEKQSGDVFSRRFLRKKKDIFALYRSQFAQESEKIKRPFLKWVFVVLFFACLSVYLIYDLFVSMWHGDEKKSKAAHLEHGVLPQKVEKVQIQETERKGKADFGYFTIENKTEILQYSELSFAQVDREILIFWDGKIIPKDVFPYDIKLLRVGKRYRIYGNVPKIDGKETDKPEKDHGLFDWGKEKENDLDIEGGDV